MMVNAAASDPIPPIDSASAMATGVVVDFGAIDKARASLPPSDFVTMIATTTAVTDPVIRQARTIQPACRMFFACR